MKSITKFFARESRDRTMTAAFIGLGLISASPFVITFNEEARLKEAREICVQNAKPDATERSLDFCARRDVIAQKSMNANYKFFGGAALFAIAAMALDYSVYGNGRNQNTPNPKNPSLQAPTRSRRNESAVQLHPLGR